MNKEIYINDFTYNTYYTVIDDNVMIDMSETFDINKLTNYTEMSYITENISLDKYPIICDTTEFGRQPTLKALSEQQYRRDKFNIRITNKEKQQISIMNKEMEDISKYPPFNSLKNKSREEFEPIDRIWDSRLNSEQK